MRSSEAAKSELLDRGLDDILQLFEIVSVVTRHIGIDRYDEPAIVKPTLDVIHGLLESNCVIAGDVIKNEQGFLAIRSWEMTPLGTIQRIRDEWQKLEGPPSLGDIVWLELTEHGRREALNETKG